MPAYDYDLFVIGGGSGGVRAGRMAASLGVRVGVAEERYLGGTCVNVGCVPKKLFSYAAHFAEDFEDAAGFGWTVGARRFDWPTLVRNKNTEIERLNGIYRRLLVNAGAEVIEARARLLDPHTVEVGGRTVTAERILVATGGWPYVPDFPGSGHAITSNEAFFLERLPERVVVVGGGYIAVEFAGIFNGLGCRTTQLYRGPLFLRGFDDDARSFLAEEVRKKGVDLHFERDVSAIERRGDSFLLTLNEGSTLECDLVMYATGRKPLSADLGLEACGVELNAAGAIVVDGNYRTNVPSIYAIGDVTDRVNLTPVALAEGMALVWHLYRDHERPVDYEYIPSAVFSQPNLATVGYTEAEARAKFGDDAIEIYRSTFTPLKHTLSGSQEKTLMKLVVERGSDRVVGAHMVGPDAGETIQGLAVALKAGATKALFDRTIGIHPTSAEEWVTMREPVARADD
ncbi:MAG: glutathione-disulfide reductase [Gammaproteobacteria bacterium]|nr:glutathione-disulfide reductase [Gammaproteobacteria bacterium]